MWQGRDFCVGQRIYFNVAGLPGRVYEAVAVWSLPGTFVNRQPDPNCLAYYDQDATLLRRIPVTNGGLTTYACYVKDLQPATVSVEVRYRFSKTGQWQPTPSPASSTSTGQQPLFLSIKMERRHRWLPVVH